MCSKNRSLLSAAIISNVIVCVFKLRVSLTWRRNSPDEEELVVEEEEEEEEGRARITTTSASDLFLDLFNNIRLDSSL